MTALHVFAGGNARAPLRDVAAVCQANELREPSELRSWNRASQKVYWDARWQVWSHMGKKEVFGTSHQCYTRAAPVLIGSAANLIRAAACRTLHS